MLFQSLLLLLTNNKQKRGEAINSGEGGLLKLAFEYEIKMIDSFR